MKYTHICLLLKFRGWDSMIGCFCFREKSGEGRGKQNAFG